jgi:glycosyltransferase involved in cell wall biosynthesis
MNRIHMFNLEAFINHTGFVDDQSVGSYLTASDVVVLPFLDGASYRRGSLMAAIQYGCAIITTTPQIHVAAFQNHENMMLVPPGDTKSLTSAIHELYDSAELRLCLRAGAAKLAANFDWKNIATDTIEFFQHVMGART